MEGVPEATDLEQCFRCHRNRHFRNQSRVVGVREQAVVGRHTDELPVKRGEMHHKLKATETFITLLMSPYNLYTRTTCIKFRNYVW